MLRGSVVRRACCFLLLAAVATAAAAAAAAVGKDGKDGGGPPDLTGSIKMPAGFDAKDIPASAMDEIQNVMKEAMSKSAGAEGISENVSAFTAAVDWGEGWIRALLAHHVLLLVLMVTTRARYYHQCAIFGWICTLVWGAERINDACKTRWQSFSKQNYFDKNGIFMSGVLSAPLLLIGFVQLVITLRRSADLLVEVKKHEFKEAAKKKGKEATKKKKGGGAAAEAKKDK
jgi:hypothetical protein